MYAEKWKCDRTAIFYSRKHDISWIMLKVRECLWAGRFFSLSSSDTACTGASVLWWRDNGNKLFLFQLFFNLFLSSWTDVFNFFFHLPFDHFSFGVIIPSSIFFLFSLSCLYPFQTIFRDVFHTCTTLLLPLSLSPSLVRMRGTKNVWRQNEKRIGNWKTKHSKITLLLRSACDVKLWSKKRNKGWNPNI